MSQRLIDTTLTLGDRLSDVKMIARDSAVYGEALNNNEITFFRTSQNELEIATYKGMGVIVDDNLATAKAGMYLTILFGPGALGYTRLPDDGEVCIHNQTSPPILT